MRATPSDRRQQILEAAIGIFAEKGFFETKMEEIAVAAGVAKGTVYEYFASKKQLFQEMLALVVQQYTDAFAQQVASEKGAAWQLREFLRAHLEFLQRHEEMAQILVKEHPLEGDEVRCQMWRSRERMIRALEQLWEQGRDRGEVPEVDAVLAARVILGAVTALSGDILWGKPAWDVAAAPEELCRLLGIRG